MPEIEVVLSPALFPFFNAEGKNIVVIDILRASSAIVTALANGVDAVIPVESLEEALEYRNKEYLIAGERNGMKVEGFDHGNSPLEFCNHELGGKEIVLTTTNGTRCIEMGRKKGNIIIGSFLNMQAVAAHLLSDDKDVLLFCAGWKNRFNLEDTLFAGALIHLLQNRFHFDCDSSLAALKLYEANQDQLDEFLEQASHVKRFKRLGVKGDKTFCLQQNIYSVVPVLKNGRLIAE